MENPRMLKLINPLGRWVIVDRDESSFRQLLDSSPTPAPTVCFVPDGRSALRTPRGPHDRMWMINSWLPDMSGCDLLEMLRDRLEGLPVVICSDRYAVEDELRACRAGATLFLCKPLDLAALRVAPEGEATLAWPATLQRDKCTGAKSVYGIVPS